MIFNKVEDVPLIIVCLLALVLVYMSLFLLIYHLVFLYKLKNTSIETVFMILMYVASLYVSWHTTFWIFYVK